MSSKRGFTLIELLVVISIIALLASVVLASLNVARGKSAVAAGETQSMSVYHGLSDALVLQVDFDECNNGASDQSGSNNALTIMNAPTSTASTYNGRGCAMMFNGINQWISVVNNSDLNPTGSATFSFWIYFNAFPNFADLLEKGIGSGLAQYYMRVNGANYNFNFSNGTRSYGSTIPLSTLGMATNTWYYVVFSIDDTAQVANIYINGAQKYKLPSPGSSVLSQNSNVLAIGGYSWDGYANATMDEVRIYNRSLTASEIGKIYALEAPRHAFVLK